MTMSTTEPTAPRYCFRCKLRTRHSQTVTRKGPETQEIRVICDRCGGLTANYVEEDLGSMQVEEDSSELT